MCGIWIRSSVFGTGSDVELAGGATWSGCRAAAARCWARSAPGAGTAALVVGAREDGEDAVAVGDVVAPARGAVGLLDGGVTMSKVGVEVLPGELVPLSSPSFVKQFSAFVVQAGDAAATRLVAYLPAGRGSVHLTGWGGLCGDGLSSRSPAA